MKKTIILGAFLLSPFFCICQITGKCIDESGKGLPFSNISIKNTSIGTVSDMEGRFLINDNSLTENNIAVISHLGYETKIMTLNKTSNTDIVLKAKTIELEEVSVISSNYKYTKSKKTGNNALSEHVVVGFSSRHLGAEIGKLFKVSKNKQYKVERIRFNIAEMGYKKATFRINFYKSIDEENIDLERYNDNAIVFEVTNSGNVDVDVSKEKLVFDEDFLVSIECINYEDNLNNKEKKHVFFSSNVFCGPIYFRDNHIKEWSPSKLKYNMCLGIQLFVKY